MAKHAAAPADAGDKKRGNLLPRLSVPLTADRTRFAVENMTDPVRERLRAVLTDPELRSKLALPDDRPPAAAADIPELPATWGAAGVGGILWDAIGQLLAKLATARGYTPAEAHAMEFSPEEKLRLEGPTAAVLDKYFPGGLARWGPEVVLLGTVAVIVNGKVETMNAAAAVRLAAATPATVGGTVLQFSQPAPPGSSASSSAASPSPAS